MSDLKRAQEIVMEQEEKLVFESFDEDDAWKLGSFIVDEMKAQGVSLAVSIRKLNGRIVFQYSPKGTAMANAVWMGKKFNMVRHLEQSSLLTAISLGMNGSSLADEKINAEECVACGGGFPIRVKGCGTVMALIVSALPHISDHEFIVGCLSKYLGVEVPRLDESMDISPITK